jgi:hypothetical protein
MKSFHITLFAFAAGLWMGCSSTPRIRPINSINEPVFHAAGYATVGAGMGNSWTVVDESKESSQPSLFVDPIIGWECNANTWASYSIIPVHWVFLLTGEQYADTLRLLPRKLHASIHAGINGFYYSQRDGWTFPADIGIGAKYLINPAHYLESDAGFDFFHFSEWSRNLSHFQIAYGYQATPRNALEISYRQTYFMLNENDGVSSKLLEYLNDDSNTELFLNHYYSFKGRHIVGPEIGWGTKNLQFGTDYYFLAGLTYRYVFK